MDQPSFASPAYAGKKKTTRREKFLAEMEAMVPWGEICDLIEPHYKRGWDAEDDRLIGGLWANFSEGRCRFVMVKDKRWEWIEEKL